MSTRPSALGRGLDALLPSSPGRPARDAELGATKEPSPTGAPAHEIPVDLIDPNPEQPRRLFDPEYVERLADSIRQHGVLQPVVVRSVGNRFELVVGERRWRATQRAGLTTIPAVVADIDTTDRLELALVENVQRRDLNPIELAHAFLALSEGGTSQENIGKRVGLDRSSIANHLRLLELPAELQGDVEAGRLTLGHAKALLQAPNPERRRYLRDRIVGDGLSVRAAEELARPAGKAARKGKARRGPRAADPNLQRVVDLLRQRFQTRIRIQGDAKRGRVEIEYFGDEDLRRITGILLGDA
ncbi:MAG: ParB/RepB/Spo0J family partition protein [Deltaproteobacteria bacterium]|nr:ParB/RepB/Spo0J family partition protein [Deltaproteobacteria bacterium]MBW2360755.1 ParB/RepB/Spo0J family partition protein [Deltaproteobacteria bacterium]